MTPTQIAALAGSGSLTRVCAARTELRLSRAKMRALLERAARNVVCEQRREASAAAARRVVCRYNLLAGRPVEVQGGIETLIAHD